MKRWTVMVVAICCLLAGCTRAKNHDTDTVVPTGTVTAAAQPIALAATPEGTGLLPLDKWPRACDLLTEADVRAVLPSTTKIVVKSRDVTFESWTVSDPLRKITAANALCNIQVWFPGTYPHTVPSTTMNVTVRAAGTPRLAKTNYDRFVKRPSLCDADLMVTGLDACSWDPVIDQWAVLKHGLTVEVQSSKPYLDGHYEGQNGLTQQDFWRLRVEPEFVKAIAAKLP